MRLQKRLIYLGVAVFVTSLYAIMRTSHEAADPRANVAKIKNGIESAKESERAHMEDLEAARSNAKQWQVEAEELAAKLKASESEVHALASQMAVLKGGAALDPATTEGASELDADAMDRARAMKLLGREPLQPGQHRLAIIVPFRNVEKELQSFVPHMHEYLKAKNVDFDLIVVNQTDDWRFNRGQLLNVGEILSRGSHDYIAMHDVDLLPLNKVLPYTQPPARTVMHLASPKLHPMYHYSNFIGGVMLIRSEDFQHINGLSNRFWGWGREDDELFWRITNHSCAGPLAQSEGAVADASRCALKIVRPEQVVKITTGYHTFKHLHDASERPRDYSKVGDQWQAGLHRDATTGVHNSKHVIKKMSVRRIKGNRYLSVEVNLECDTVATPWCKWYKKCVDGFYRAKPEHKVCTFCVQKCWTGFALVGKCTQTTGPACKKIGRDISPAEARKWPEGTISH